MGSYFECLVSLVVVLLWEVWETLGGRTQLEDVVSWKVGGGRHLGESCL
jgi:hypothetical protein